MASPTLKDVADHAGVGMSTVSRVLNGSMRVSDRTREKVLASIEALGYRPASLPRPAFSGPTFTIGAAVPFFTFPSFIERLAGVQSVMDQFADRLVTYSIRGPRQLLDQLRLMVRQDRVDGLLVMTLRFPESDVRRANPEIPIVVIDSETSVLYPHNKIDNVAGGRLAAEYLIRRGHRDIGFVGDLRDDTFGFTSAYQRLEGCQHALAQAGLPINPDWYRFGEHSTESARANAGQILSLPKRPTALFASCDTLALGVLDAVQTLGLRVPDDVAVIGFDDIPTAHYVNLTTVRQPLFESGQWGARALIDWLQDGAPDHEAWEWDMPMTVIERQTA